MRLVELIQTCSACPSQWEGKLEDGQEVYIRYRHGSLTWAVGYNVRGRTYGQGVTMKYLPRMADGFMDEEEMLRHTGFTL